MDAVHLCNVASSTRPSLSAMQYGPAMLGASFPDLLYRLCISSTVRISPEYCSMFLRPFPKMIALFSLFRVSTGSPLVANSPDDRDFLGPRCACFISRFMNSARQCGQYSIPMHVGA